jgi:hypothetical protein
MTNPVNPNSPAIPIGILLLTTPGMSSPIIFRQVVYNEGLNHLFSLPNFQNTAQRQLVLEVLETLVSQLFPPSKGPDQPKPIDVKPIEIGEGGGKQPAFADLMRLPGLLPIGLIASAVIKMLGGMFSTIQPVGLPSMPSQAPLPKSHGEEKVVQGDKEGGKLAPALPKENQARVIISPTPPPPAKDVENSLPPEAKPPVVMPGAGKAPLEAPMKAPAEQPPIQSPALGIPRPEVKVALPPSPAPNPAVQSQTPPSPTLEKSSSDMLSSPSSSREATLLAPQTKIPPPDIALKAPVAEGQPAKGDIAAAKMSIPTPLPMPPAASPTGFGVLGQNQAVDQFRRTTASTSKKGADEESDEEENPDEEGRDFFSDDERR